MTDNPYKVGAHKCLNCQEIMYHSALLALDTTHRGIDRDIHKLIGCDKAKGTRYLACPKCGAKHEMLEWSGAPGEGGKWKLGNLIKE